MRALLIALVLPLASQALFFGNSCGCSCPPRPCGVTPVCPPPPVCGGGGFPQPQLMPIFQPQGYAAAPQQQPQEILGAQAQQSNPQELVASSQQSQVETAPVEAEPVAEAEAPQETAIEAVPADHSEAQADNTVYDDIVNSAQQTAPAAQEYSATSRRRYHIIRRAPPANFDPKCNSETLKTIIHQNIGDSTSSSKRAIQKVASEEIGGHVDVICSTGTFSYIVNTELYCETEKDGITCFAFRQSN